MPDISELFRYWWKQILAVVLITVLVVGLITFMKPSQYLAASTAVPANAFGGDRASVFNENIQALYATLGTTDELDVVVGTAQLDTVYLAVADQLALYDNNDRTSKPNPRLEAARNLKGNTQVTKTGYGELKVKVWDRDAERAARLANALMAKLNAMHQSLQQQNNIALLANLQANRSRMIAELDSLSGSIQYDSMNQVVRSSLITEENKRTRSIRRDALYTQLAEYENLINQYRLVADSRNNVLLVVEKARAAEKPDRPKRLTILLATAVLSFIFSLLLALVLHRKKYKTA